MQTWHIHLKGQVQGVGFRPYVFLIARQFNLKGWVTNDVDGVHIQFNATAEQAMAFQHHLLQDVPPNAYITQQIRRAVPHQSYSDFQILPSTSKGLLNGLITPDIALCMDCRQELYQVDSRRHNYPFITCTNCGPRYSIAQSLPYDRERTTMRSFQMCTECNAEYENWQDKRYYAQTNSCPNCAIQLSLRHRQETEYQTVDTWNIIQQIITAWEAGKIVAIKGIGGFLLTADANHPKAIKELRQRKQRPSKPFAIMFPHSSSIAQVAKLSSAALQQLHGPISPIVLLETKKEATDELAIDLIAPNQRQIGVMLPYAPFYDLLLTTYQKPIIATSANRSSAPIFFKETTTPNELDELAEMVVSNNRDIILPQDDSVIQYTPFHDHPILYRRSRGMAPNFFSKELNFPNPDVLAMGAMLKSTFSFVHHGIIVTSQYLGDLSNYLTESNFQTTLQHLWQLLHAQPQSILIDAHPNYPSSAIGKQLAEEYAIPLIKVQHHIAHFAALLGERQLINTTEPILGIIWDGLGLGEDDQLWGGEFFVYHRRQFERLAHFDYFPVLAGDKMAKEPRLAALAATYDLPTAIPYLQEKFTTTEWRIYQQLLTKKLPLQTSSVGRLFDAVASLLGLLDTQTFEGEAAMQLEKLAIQYFQQNDLSIDLPNFQQKKLTFNNCKTCLLAEVIADMQKEKSKAYIAARFHFLLVQIIKWVAQKKAIQKIGFSGGVFQNSLLIDLIRHHLGTLFELYFHQQLSPNDENISVGQVFVYQFDLKLKYESH